MNVENQLDSLALSKFAETLMKGVRDPSIKQADRVLNGELKAKLPLNVRDIASGLNR